MKHHILIRLVMLGVFWLALQCWEHFGWEFMSVIHSTYCAHLQIIIQFYIINMFKLLKTGCLLATILLSLTQW